MYQALYQQRPFGAMILALTMLIQACGGATVGKEEASSPSGASSTGGVGDPTIEAAPPQPAFPGLELRTWNVPLEPISTNDVAYTRVYEFKYDRTTNSCRLATSTVPPLTDANRQVRRPCHPNRRWTG